MLIVPLTGKISRQNLPYVTIALILINAFVFFVLQAGDRKNHGKAMAFYFDSGLAKIETSRYLDYLQSEKPDEPISDSLIQKRNQRDSIALLYARMQRDDLFMTRLKSHQIITPGEEVFIEWKRLRTEYEGLLSKVVTYRYGFKPAERELITSITCMFLHGSVMHLVGNMVFLWLVGAVLELGCGRPFYVLLYFVGGFCATVLFALANMHSTIPCIGASGAISGLMGAFTVMYGRKKIKVFYSLGFYFNYAHVPAIILLPVWIGNEVFQLLFGGHSQVAYMAHIGGLIGGAGLGAANLMFLRPADEKMFEDDPTDKIPGLLEKALDRVARLDMVGARPIFEQVLEMDPDNHDALIQLYNMDKLEPHSQRFHDSAARLLRHLSNDGKAHKELHRIYQEYGGLSKSLKLHRDLLFRIASIFCEHGHLDEAERIFGLFIKTIPSFQMIPTGVLKLATAFQKGGADQKGIQYLHFICSQYPESTESRVAHQLLKRHGP
ncbi:MAG: rhomboid family intramembrane serine protease [Thermodesulfobacteriota bacterium]|nr:rhomboid family intramembrane serine protease [Thermodesulfobacteriota bacterium]